MHRIANLERRYSGSASDDLHQSIFPSRWALIRQVKCPQSSTNPLYPTSDTSSTLEYTHRQPIGSSGFGDVYVRVETKYSQLPHDKLYNVDGDGVVAGC